MRRCPRLTLIIGLSVWACGDPVDPVGPADGTVAISTATAGDDPDPDGFQVAIDGTDSLALVPSGTAEVDLPPGRHSLRLSGVAEHCSVDPGAAVEVDVTAGRTTPVAFQVSCPGTAIRVTVTTAGPDPDRDGYLLTIDGMDSVALGPRGAATVNVAPGRHALQLQGVVDYCSVYPKASLEVEITRGRTIPVGFAVYCQRTDAPAPPTGGRGARVSATTTGSDLDREYRVLVGKGGGGSQLTSISSNGTLGIRLDPGTHTIGLTEVAPNCDIDGPASYTVTITAGETVPVEFAVVCTARAAFAGITGNWQFSTTSAVAGMRRMRIGGSITQSGSVVTGAVHATGSNCFDSLTTIGLTGSLTDSEVSLTSTPARRQVITLTGRVTLDSISGTYSISGGCADGDRGSVTGSKVRSINGAWRIMFGSNEQEVGSGLAGLTQATTSSEGSFAVVGAVSNSFDGAICFGGTVTGGSPTSHSFIRGRSVTLEIETGCGRVIVQGIANEADSEIIARYHVVGGLLNGNSGSACLGRNFYQLCHLPPFF